MTTLRATALLALLIAPPAVADDCDHTASRDATIDAAGARLIEIEAGAGSLEVRGEDGLGEVRATGEACASDPELLEEIRIETRQQGDRLLVRAVLPEGGGWRDGQARLDLEITVPAGVALEVDDSSGSLAVRHTGPLELRDSSGSIDIVDVDGDLSIHDSSGGIDVEDVVGEVRISDSSGSIEVRQVDGSVIVERDSSGSIEVTDVSADVIVERDSSGSITVRGIGGDFTVRRDGSGGIHHSDVRGQVDVPPGD